MKLYKNKNMTFDAEKTSDAISRAHEQGGWLVLYDHGASINTSDPITTSLVHCGTSGDIESYAGGTLIFLDSDDFENSLNGPDWEYILRALYTYENLPRFAYLEEFIDEAAIRTIISCHDEEAT